MRLQSFILLAGALLLSSCASTSKLSSTGIKPGERIVFGRLTDANPDGRELRLSFVTSKEAQSPLLNLGNPLPERDPKTGFFWSTLPVATNYFGVRSIHFAVKDENGAALIRDDESRTALFGIEIPEGKEPVYVGDIMIRSASVLIGKTFFGGSDHEFVLQDISVAKDSASAQKFLADAGFPAAEMKERILSVKGVKLFAPGLHFPKRFEK